MLIYDEIPVDGKVLTVNTDTVNTNNLPTTFSVVRLINAIKSDAKKSYQGVLSNGNSSIKSVLANGVDKSSSQYNNAGIMPKEKKQIIQCIM